MLMTVAQQQAWLRQQARLRQQAVWRTYSLAYVPTPDWLAGYLGIVQPDAIFLPPTFRNKGGGRRAVTGQGRAVTGQGRAWKLLLLPSPVLYLASLRHCSSLCR